MEPGVDAPRRTISNRSSSAITPASTARSTFWPIVARAGSPSSSLEVRRAARLERIAHVTSVPGSSRARSTRASSVCAAECPAPTTSVRRPAKRARSRPSTSGSGGTMRSATSAAPSGSRPFEPSRFGVRIVPDASITERARSSATSPSASRVRSTNGAAARPVVRVRSMPSRLTASTSTPVRMCGASAGSAASGSRYPSTNWSPVGRRAGFGAAQPAASSSSRAVASTSSAHEEKSRTCPHERMPSPTRGPASSTVKGMSRACRCAAAASPMGPAPMIATGRASRRGRVVAGGMRSTRVMVSPISMIIDEACRTTISMSVDMR